MRSPAMSPISVYGALRGPRFTLATSNAVPPAGPVIAVRFFTTPSGPTMTDSQARSALSKETRFSMARKTSDEIRNREVFAGPAPTALTC